MMTNPKVKLANEIKDIVKFKNKPESVVIAEAIKVGVYKLWQETMLDQYLKGKITKKQAIKSLGFELVNLAEKQKNAVIEDIKWGLANA